MIDVFLETNTAIQDIPAALSGFDVGRIQVRNAGPTEIWERNQGGGWAKSQVRNTTFEQLSHEHIELGAWTVAFGGGFSEVVADGLPLLLTENEAIAFLEHFARYQYQLEDAIGCSVNNVDGRACALACFSVREFKAMVDRNSKWGSKIADWVIKSQKCGMDEVGIVIAYKAY